MSDEKINNLKQQIKDLENRVRELESKDGSKKSAAEAMRMILIGPPGAG
jgi:chaperonin cofactor prefoldin